MIAKIAHELRSPLTSIKGFSTTLLKRWDRFNDEQRVQLIGTIAADAERMGRIVSEVLDLARIEAGRLELHCQIAEIAPLVDRAVGLCGSLQGVERVSAEVPEGLTAWADPDRVEHILFNLIENAIRFSDEGPITIRAHRGDGSVVIEVTDRGFGIPDEQLGSLFTGPGPRGGKRTPSGSGLGLYLSRRLVEAHDGSISVNSAVGKGSTFNVRLPEESPAHQGAEK